MRSWRTSSACCCRRKPSCNGGCACCESWTMMAAQPATHLLAVVARGVGADLMTFLTWRELVYRFSNFPDSPSTTRSLSATTRHLVGARSPTAERTARGTHGSSAARRLRPLAPPPPQHQPHSTLRVSTAPPPLPPLLYPHLRRPRPPPPSAGMEMPPQASPPSQEASP